MLTVKIEKNPSENVKAISIIACHEVSPLFNSDGVFGISCEIYGADNQTGQTFERTVILGNGSDDKPSHVYVENSHGRTVQGYSFQGGV